MARDGKWYSVRRWPSVVACLDSDLACKNTVLLDPYFDQIAALPHCRWATATLAAWTSCIAIYSPNHQKHFTRQDFSAEYTQRKKKQSAFDDK